MNVEPLRIVLSEIRPEFDFGRSKDFISEGMLDSFDVIMLVAALDKKFAISIDGSEIVPENFRSFDAMANLLRKHGVSL